MVVGLSSPCGPGPILGTEKEDSHPQHDEVLGFSPRRPGWSAGRPPQASVQPGSLAGCRKDLPEISYSGL